MKKQSYSNHPKYNPWFHGVLPGLILFVFIASVVNLSSSIRDSMNILSSVIISVMSVVLMFLWYFTRQFAVRLQDRLIRSEENFRHYVLAGKPLDPRLEMMQIIALRFSPDNEFPDLCKEAIDKELTNPEIKKSISKWKGDYHRI